MLAVSIALAGCGGDTETGEEGSAASPGPAPTVGAGTEAFTPEAGSSCADFDPVSPTEGIATLPQNIDCDGHTRKFVAEGAPCDPGAYRPVAGHLVCRADGKLIRPPTAPTTPPCKPGETRTLPGGLVEKCVEIPPPE